MSDVFLEWRFEEYSKSVRSRLDELCDAAELLAKRAQKQILYSYFLKALLIILGALSAARSALGHSPFMNEETTGVVFTIIGILIASLAGIEAAFKFEKRSGELTLLSASSRSDFDDMSASLLKNDSQANPEARIDGAMTLIEAINKKLSQIKVDAAKLGVNLAFEMLKSISITDRNASLYGTPPSEPEPAGSGMKPKSSNQKRRTISANQPDIEPT